jgi:hypothetical protein
MVCRRVAAEALDLSRLLKVPFMDGLRCKPSTALIFSKLLRPKVRPLVFAEDILFGPFMDGI